MGAYITRNAKAERAWLLGSRLQHNRCTPFSSMVDFSLDDLPYKCEICKISFKSSQAIKRHNVMHVRREKPWTP